LELIEKNKSATTEKTANKHHILGVHYRKEQYGVNEKTSMRWFGLVGGKVEGPD
jgi:hypothetical protein